MGCDIHMVVERRVRDPKDGSSWWVCITTFPYAAAPHYKKSQFGGVDYSSFAVSERNYGRFAALAGVRGAGPEPRGMPEDASDTARYWEKHWDGDGHSHSWLPLREAAKIFLETDYSEKKNDPKSFLCKYPCNHFFGVEDDDADQYRLVFWFDN